MFSVIFEVHPSRKIRPLSRDCEKIKTDPGRDRRLHRQRALREHAPAGLDPVAFDLARREIRGALADCGKHHDTQAAQAGRGVSRTTICGWARSSADTAPPAGASLVEQRLDETEIGHAKFMTLTEVHPKPV